MNRIERAIDEQLRSFICPEEANDQEQKKGRFTYSQTTGFRRGTESIMISAIDHGLKHKKLFKLSDIQKHRRKRRRGPRVLVL